MTHLSLGGLRNRQAGGATLEVWTRRAFSAGSLILTPQTTEYKDRYFTYSRSVLAKSPEEHVGKRIVLDGRLYGMPTEARSFSLFFAVQRSDDADQCNLQQSFSEISLQADISLPALADNNKRKHLAMKFGSDELAQMPIITNPKHIKKGVRLVCSTDLELKALHEAHQKAQIAEKAQKKAKKQGN